MKKIASILVLVLMLGIVAISGCTSSDSTQTPANDSNSSYAATSEPATSSSSDTNVTGTNSSSKDNSSSDYSSSSDSSSSSTSSSDSGAYIGNANTHVFHYASCYHVNAMKDSNKVYFSSAKAAEDAGYRPCKDCNP